MRKTPRPETKRIAFLRERRLKAAKMFDKGLRPAEVARRLGVSKQSTSLWHQQWLKGGAKSLTGSDRLGRKPGLDAQELEQVRAALLAGPQAHGFDSPVWTLQRVAALIERLTGQSYHVGHVWKVLRGLGFTRQKPTLRPQQRNEGKIRGFRRSTWPAAKKKPGAKTP